MLGALGFMMRRFGLPVLPLILGVILGPRIEGQLRKTLQLSAGDPAGLWSEPIAVGIYIIMAIILLWPLLFKLYRRNRPAAAPAASRRSPARQRRGMPPAPTATAPAPAVTPATATATASSTGTAHHRNTPI